MRELILKMSMSLDGFVGSPDGEIKWVFDSDPQATAWTVKTVWNASLHIMGSRTFRGPAILKTVNTTAALKEDGDSWKKAHVASGDLAEEVAKLKAQDGKPIVAHGGAGFARSLVARGLVDQYDLLVHPVALGKGLPIFSDLTLPKPLKLISSTAFPKGSVAQIYRPA